MKRFLLAASLCLFAVQGAWAVPVGTSAPASIPSIPSLGQALRGQGWSLIGTDGFNPSVGTNVVPNSEVSGSKTSATFRAQEVSPVTVPAERLVFTNHFGNAAPSQELPNTNAVYWHFALANPSTTENFPGTIGGEQSARVAPLTIAISDPLYYPVKANTPYWVYDDAAVTNLTGTVISAYTVSSGAAGWNQSATEGAAQEDCVNAAQACIAVGPTSSGAIHAVVLGFTGANPSKTIACVGDSIAAATGDTSLHGGYCGRVALQDFALNLQWPAATVGFGYLNTARGAQSLNVFLANQHKVSIGLDGLATNVVDDMGTNDLGAITLATMQADKIAYALLFLSQGQKYITITLFPKTTSTDGFLTATNQTTLGSIETERVGFNDWLRDTSSNGFVAQTKAACLADANCAAATNNSPQVAIADTGAAVEVNSSNALTVDGGRWLAPTNGGADCPYSGSVTSGPSTTQITDTGLNAVTINTYRGYGVVFTSGPALGGANGAVSLQTTAGVLQFTALSAAPVVGNTYKLCNTVAALDGTHPLPFGHVKAAQAFNTGLLQ